MNFDLQNPWTPSSWKSKPISQQAEYPDKEAFSSELGKLRVLPPLVPSEEIEKLKENLANVYNGKGFVLQLGDCAERFADCNAETTHQKILFYNLLGDIFTKITNTPTTVIGRMAGQYAKPRTELYEVIDGEKVLNFKGENINGFNAHERTPDPKRMTEGHIKSSQVLEFANKMKTSKISCPELIKKINAFNSELNNATDIEVRDSHLNVLNAEDQLELKRDVFVSHEALMLDYETTQVRKVDNKYYDLSSHFLWIGMRTNGHAGAHVEFFRGLENPIGVKISKDVTSSPENIQHAIEMIKTLNPQNQEGKVVLITRFGTRYVTECLPKILKAVNDHGLKVLWFIDGVHGNTQTVSRIKTRKFADIKEEILTTLVIFKEFGVQLNGIHLEITPDEVTECLGGAYFEVVEEDLSRNYTSLCDPRLNFAQSVELISSVATQMNNESK